MSTNQPPQGPGPYQQGQPQWPYGQPQQGTPPPQAPYGAPAPQQGPYGQPQQGTPPPGLPPQNWATLDNGEPPRSKGRRGILIGVVAVLIVGLIGGGLTFAWSKLSGGGPQPASALPANAFGYARIDLDPSASQKIDLIRLLRKVPEFSDATGITEDTDDLREKIFEGIAGDGCDVDYEDDVKSWIGDRTGVGVVPGEEHPEVVLAIQVSDQDAASDAIDKLDKECTDRPEITDEAISAEIPAGTGRIGTGLGHEDTGDESSDDETGVAFVGDYMVMADEQDFADQVAEDAEESPLSDDETFAADMDELGDEGVASMWFDGEGLLEAAEESGASEDDLAAIEEQGIDSAALAVRAGSDYIELDGFANSDDPLGGEESKVAELPETTMLATSIANGGDAVEKSWDTFVTGMDTTGTSGQQMIADIEYATGLTMPEDLAALLGDNFLLAVDGENLGPDLFESPDSLSDLDVGAAVTSDSPDTARVVDDLVRMLTDGAASEGLLLDLTNEETDDGVVVASNSDYAEQLADGGGGLGDSDRFKTAVPNADDAENVLYLDMTRFSEVAEEFAEADGEELPEEFDTIDPMEAVGFSTSSSDDQMSATLRLTFD